MFTNNLNPTAFHIFNFSIRWYSLVYLAAALYVYFYMHKSKLLKFISEEKKDAFFITLFFSMIFFSRLFEVLFYEPGYYFRNKDEILKIYHGGLSFHGGLFGVILASYLFLKFHKKQSITLSFLNSLTKPITLFLFFGRIANFFNHEIYGKITNLPWCVDFIVVPGCRHPSQLYEALLWLTIFVLLSFKFNYKLSKLFKLRFLVWLHNNKFTFALFYYNLMRFFIEFTKVSPMFLGLTIGQWLCTVFIISIFVVYKKYYSNKLHHI